MELNIISWNVNFIHDNWSDRLIKINKTLEKEVNKTDIMCLQEATLPFSDIFTSMYKFLKGTNLKYFASEEIFMEKKYIYDKIHFYFPRYKEFVVFLFEKIMDKFLYLLTLFNSYFGEKIKKIYFEHPFVIIILSILCPFIFLGQWFFFGMLTIVNKKIPSKIKCKYIGRTIQYMDFKYNNKDITLVNVHLTPGSGDEKKNKRLSQIKKIVEFFDKKTNVILCGDFNSKPNSKVIKFLKTTQYKNCGKIINKKNLKTFPSKNPKKCIDYFFMKGNIEIKDYKLFGTYKATDHKGIKATFIV